MSTRNLHFLYDRLNLFSGFYRQRDDSIRAIVNWDPNFQHFQKLTRQKYLKMTNENTPTNSLNKLLPSNFA